MKHFLLLIIFIFLNSPVAYAADLDYEIGQMIMIGFNGLSVDENSDVIRAINRYHIGGVVLYDRSIKTEKFRNIKSPEQLRRLTSDLQKYSQTPLFIAIDEEGGRVNRLKPRYGFPATISAGALGNFRDLKQTKQFADIVAKELVKSGININFAPVVDLYINPKGAGLNAACRSFSASPWEVVEQAKVFIRSFHQRNIACALKHFPGQGSAQTDTHNTVVDVTKSWDPMELKPYQILLRQVPCEMVMISHVLNKNIDSNYPASLSEVTIKQLLREKLHFQGIVISDSLQMVAIREKYSLRESIKLAVNAGNDILLFSNKYDDGVLINIIAAFKSLVQTGEIKPETVHEAYQRIFQLKLKMLKG